MSYVMNPTFWFYPRHNLVDDDRLMKWDMDSSDDPFTVATIKGEPAETEKG